RHSVFERAARDHRQFRIHRGENRSNLPGGPRFPVLRVTIVSSRMSRCCRLHRAESVLEVRFRVRDSVNFTLTNTPEQNRTEQNRTEQNRTEQNRTEKTLTTPESVDSDERSNIPEYPLLRNWRGWKDYHDNIT